MIRLRLTCHTMAISIMLAATPACATDVQAFRRSYRLLADCKVNDIEFCGGYISGVLDVFAALHAGTGNPKFRLCLPATLHPPS